MDADRLAELDVERQFLLRSLTDLEREHDAGDVDDVDYATLRDGYTARAAATMRAMERGANPAADAPRHWGRLLAWTAVIVVAAAAAGILLARSWGERTAADVSPTGSTCSDGTVGCTLSEARASMATDPVHSIDLFAQVLDIDPDNVEAITYGAWLSAASAMTSGNAAFISATAQPALDQFDRAIALDPSYADPQCFSAIVRYKALGQPAEIAKPYIDACLAADPPQEARQLAEALQAAIDADIARSPATTTAP